MSKVYCPVVNRASEIPEAVANEILFLLGSSDICADIIDEAKIDFVKVQPGEFFCIDKKDLHFSNGFESRLVLAVYVALFQGSDFDCFEEI